MIHKIIFIVNFITTTLIFANNHIQPSEVELFVDTHNIEKMHNVNIEFHHPIEQPLSKLPLKSSAFVTIIKYKNKYISYYRASNPNYKGISKTGFPNKLTRYAISYDGIDWYYPKNNIIIKEPPFAHNFSPFLDKNPLSKKEYRFKALAGVDDNFIKNIHLLPNPFKYKFLSLKEKMLYWGYPKNYKSGLYSFGSADGIHWKRISNEPVITVLPGVKAFDSQNVSFWSEAESRYVCFFRSWKKIYSKKKKRKIWVRMVSKTTSKDFIHWDKPILIKANIGSEQLYTTQTHPYYRNQSIYISLATRFISDRGNITDIMFMSMRAGNNYFDRTFKEAYIKPGLNKKRWKNRANYVALNVIETDKNTMSIYHSKSRHRYTLRIDGFSSIYAGFKKGFVITKPFLINNKQNLFINYSTSANGYVKILLYDNNGNKINESIKIYGDKISQKVKWKNGKKLFSKEEKLLYIKFIMKEADIFSYYFK